MATEVKLPSLGENVDEGEVVSVLVSKGDSVSQEQPLIEVESDKATLEVPSDAAGTVAEIKVGEGDKVKVGQVIVVLDGDAAPAKKEEAKKEPAEEPEKDASADESEKAEAPAKKSAKKEKSEKKEQPAEEPDEDKEEEKTEDEKEEKADDDDGGRDIPADSGSERPPVFASPSVRQFAREIGVDIYDVKGSGPHGRISADDVKKHSRLAKAAGGGTAGAPAPVALPDFERFGPVDRQKMNNIRRKTVEHMARCWSTIPHVTLHDKADVTDVEALRQKYKKKADAAGGKLTITAILMKVVASALKAHPKLNASVDAARQEIVFKQYYHIGVAADTDRGLVVPVVRDADRKNIIELAVEMTALADKARDGKLGLDDMQGASFTITNLGGIGCDFFSPIVNHPEVAILGVGTAKKEMVERNGEMTPRLMVPLSLSFDHRLVDGADGARFLQWLIGALEEPMLMAMEG